MTVRGSGLAAPPGRGRGGDAGSYQKNDSRGEGHGGLLRVGSLRNSAAALHRRAALGRGASSTQGQGGGGGLHRCFFLLSAAGGGYVGLWATEFWQG